MGRATLPINMHVILVRVNLTLQYKLQKPCYYVTFSKMKLAKSFTRHDAVFLKIL